jgi:sugar phosphate isomerase/epimerase
MPASNNRFERRKFLCQGAISTTSVIAAPLVKASAPPSRSPVDLQGQVGLTVGSFQKHYSSIVDGRKLRLIDLPKRMKNELGMKVLDLMTASFPSMDLQFLDELRNEAIKNDCIITNLKMNQPDVDIGSTDSDERLRSLQVYRKTIDAAAVLGCRWVRPLPKSKLSSWNGYVDSYRHLIDYAKPKGISILVENYGWMKDDPDAIPSLIRAVGEGIDAAPDTGNWTDAVRYEGLKKAYPLAVTCDFKAFAFDEKGNHPQYDLKKCFDIGREAGFNGPWCIEHFHDELPKLFEEILRIKEMILAWRKL